MNKQEVFETMVRGLAAQGWQQSVRDGDICLYRGPDGLKCAAGHVLADEHYNSCFEGASVCTTGRGRVAQALLAQGVEPEALELIAAAQIAHDDSSPSSPSSMRARFEWLCGDHNVTWPEGV